MPRDTTRAARLESAIFWLLGAILVFRYPLHAVVSPPYLMDFEVYRTVAERVVAGEGARVYEPTTSARMVFKYAPPWAMVFAPLGWVPATSGAILWLGLDLLALLMTLVVCRRLSRVAGLRPHPLIPLAACFVILRPLAEEMGNGQSNALWGFLMAAFVSGAATRPWQASGALAAAILLKLPAALVLPYLALQRRWAAVARASALAGLACGAAVLVLAPRDPLALIQRWWRALMYSPRTEAFEIGNQSVLALLGRLFTDDGHGLNLASLPPAVLPPIALALLAAAVAAVSWPRGASSPARFLYDSAMLVVLMVLFSPSAWLATYTALLFPVSTAAAGLLQPPVCRDRPSLALATLVLGLALLTHRKVWHLLGVTAWRGETYLFLVFMILPWMGLALLGLLFRLRQIHRPGPSAGTSRN